MEQWENKLKFKVSFGEIHILSKNILSLGFELKDRIHEKVSIYDNRDFLMKQLDRRIRLKVLWNDFRIISTDIIVDDQGIKSKVEYDIVVSNPDDADKILNSMDYFIVSSYERYKNTFFKANETVKATIEEYPFDSYLEIEWNDREVTFVANTLWYDLANQVSKDINTLFAEWRKENGLEQTSIMDFENYDQSSFQFKENE
jgi:adenylate cyclase class IV